MKANHFRLTNMGVPEPGQTFGRYRILELLGQGGMARVYKASDLSLNRFVALKFLQGDSTELAERFVLEARSQARIEHERICKIFEAGEIEGTRYISMQWIAGTTLKEAMPAISREQRLQLMREVAEAVHAAHQAGVIHRDIKPSNIMVTRAEDGHWIPYVLDFGLAREVQTPGMTASGTVVGSPWYMSPEQARGDVRRLDGRTDVYSLGVTLYELLTQNLPFDGDSALDVLMKVLQEEPKPLRQLDPSIQPDLETIVMKCLEKDPEQRYGSAKALAEDLRRYLEGEPLAATPANFVQRTLRKLRRRKAVAVAAGVAILAILIFGGIALNTRWNAEKQALLAQEFGRRIQEVESILKYAHLLPLHDVAPERERVKQKMKEIEEEMQKIGAAGVGPGHYALGRGYLALHEYEQARYHLEAAWQSYREPGIANALGLALGEQYRNGLEEAERIGNQAQRNKKKAELESRFREPALRYLQLGSGSPTGPPDYGKALIAFYDEKWETALRLTGETLRKDQTLYEALRLQGDVYAAMAQQKRARGESDAALQDLDNALTRYAKASEQAQSDEQIYLNECDVWSRIMSIRNERGDDPKEAFQSSLDSCGKAIQANSQNPEAYDKKAFAGSRWADHLYYTGQDSDPAYLESIDLSRRALTLGTRPAPAQKNIGYCYLGLADQAANHGKPYQALFQQSIESYQKALASEGNDVAAYHNIGYAYERLARLNLKEGIDPKPMAQKAIDYYDRALTFDPAESHIVYNNIGLEYELLGNYALNRGIDPTVDFNRALEYYEKAIRGNPEYAAPRSNRGNIYLSLANYALIHGHDPHDYWDRAKHEYQEASRVAPKRDFPYINLAGVLTARAEYLLDTGGQGAAALLEEAKRNLDRAIEINSTFSHTFSQYGNMLRLTARFLIDSHRPASQELAQAAANLDQAKTLDPSDPLPWLGAGRTDLLAARLQMDQGKLPIEMFRRAESNLAQAVKLNSADNQVYCVLADLYRLEASYLLAQKKDPEMSIQTGLQMADQALKIHPNLAEALAIRGILLQQNAMLQQDPSLRRKWNQQGKDLIRQALQLNKNLAHRFHSDM